MIALRLITALILIFILHFFLTSYSSMVEYVYDTLQLPRLFYSETSSMLTTLMLLFLVVSALVVVATTLYTRGKET
ncbi:MAG: hypothetical protein ACK4SY_06740 [Pyrobaculum sp.]